MHRAWNNQPTRRQLLLVGLILILGSTAVWAGGSRERQDPPDEVQLIAVRGEITSVERTGDDTVLTVRTDAGPEVEVDVPTRMAESLGIREGDRFESEEQILSNQRERLRVLQFSIDR